MSDETLRGNIAHGPERVSTFVGLRRAALVVGTVQVWAVTAYAVTGLVPYLFPGLWLGDVHGVLAGLLWIPGLLFGLPGIWLALTGWFAGLVLTIGGFAMLPATLRRVSTTVTVWVAVGTLLSLAFTVVALTPLGGDVRTWVLD